MLSRTEPINMGDRLGPVRQLILQPTNFCNLDCSYCYLPKRNDTHKMSAEIASRALDRVIEFDRLDETLEIRWHAGEPLVVGVEHLNEMLDLLNQRTQSHSLKLIHSIQTNGTLIDDDFCIMAKEKGIIVGVSLDGPKIYHDRNRVMRDGEGTFTNVMQGISKLKGKGIGFDVICVLTDDSLDYPDNIYMFFCELGARRIGFNLEESEGENDSFIHQQENTVERYKGFMQRVYQLSRDGPVKIREIEEMKKVIFEGIDNIRHVSNSPFVQVSVDSRGQLFTYSPELLGMTDPKYGQFSLGNVMQHSIQEMAANPAFSRIAADIEQGVSNCLQDCAYYRVCGGGSPSNKLGETGSFHSTETWHCRTRYQALAEVVMENMEVASS